MAKYNIVCEITEEQNIVVQEIASNIRITSEQLFQRFWDGYTSEGIQMDGCIWAQIQQWLKEKLDKDVKSNTLLIKKIADEL